MQKVSRKILSVAVAFVLVLGMFSAVLPSLELSSKVKAEATDWTYDYGELFSDFVAKQKSEGKNYNGVVLPDTRALNTVNADGVDAYGIFNCQGLHLMREGRLGVADSFFKGTAVGAKPEEIHPYIVYNVTPGTSFKVSAAGYDELTHIGCGVSDNERYLNFYVSMDGVTWIPVDAKRDFIGVWSISNAYDEYHYTIDNVGEFTNFVKVEYPMTMASRRAPDANGIIHLPNESLLVCAVSCTPADTYSANGETLFQAKTLGQQRELWEEYFNAYPDAICNAAEDINNAYKAGTLEYSMLNNKPWGTYEDEKRRSLITMVKPGSHFYLETANQAYMQDVGKALVNMGELESADQARIRVYSSATLSDDADWTEHNPMPYCMPSATYTPTFNFYLPENHIYVKIVYPHKGSFARLTMENGSAPTVECGNTGCFFNDMVFTPYEEGETDVSYDYTDTATKGWSSVSNVTTNTLGLKVSDRLYNNLPNGNANNTGTVHPKGFYSVTYEVEGGKMFSLDYALRNNTATNNYGKGTYEANVGTTGSRMEFEISASNDGTNWYNFYETESGFAETTAVSSNRRAFDVHYLVPENAKYVRVSFDLLGNGFIGTGSDQRYFNDAMYIRKVSVADANNVADNKIYSYTTDYTATLATTKYKTDTSTATPDGSTAFTGNWDYLIKSNGVQGIYAGTKERPYVVYNVKPGTIFKADYKMRYYDKGFSETDAQENVNNGVAGARQDLVEFEFFVYGKSSKSETWTLLHKTESDNLTVVESVLCYSSISVNLPDYVDQVKVEFPNTGSFERFDPTGKTSYGTLAGNDSALLYNIQFVDPSSEESGVYYGTLDDASTITNAMKTDLSVYHSNGVSVVNSEGIKANRDNAFVIYKIGANSTVALKSKDNLSFEYSVDDSTYKPFEAAKICGMYIIPAVSEKSYVKVMLSNGQAISFADCELLPPTVKFYVPYLDKSYQIELENYGDTAANLVPTANMLRPGYTFNGWTNEGDTEQLYIDTTYEAIYVKTDAVTYTVTYTVNGNTTTKADVKFDDRITISAPETNSSGQAFSKWVDAKGATVSDNANFSFLASGDIDLTAVYAEAKESINPYIYTTDKAVVTANDNGTWNMSVIWRTAMPKDIKIVESGIILGTDVDSASLVFWDDKVQSGTFKMVHNNASANKTTMYTVKNIAADKVRAARPYARLTNGAVIYGDIVKARGGAAVESNFDFYGSISPDVLSSYLDRALTYHIVDGGEYGAKDVIRQTDAKYFARALCHWEPAISDVNRFETYKKTIAAVHQMDPEIILEACIFETCGPKMNQIPIPAWVFEAFGQPVVERNFDYEEMLHANGYGYQRWNENLHIPSISTLEFQMFTYYRACCYIDMGIEAIHFGQMNLIGAVGGNASVVDSASWTKVIDMINTYAKTNARRGYLIVNGHYPLQNLTRSDDSSKMLVDFNMFPLRITAKTGSTSHTPSESFQEVMLAMNGDAPYTTSRQANAANKISPSGYTYTNYPYLLEFDNWGVNDIAKLNTLSGSWGYDEISWYANQNAADRRQYLTDISLQVKNMTSAPNGHVALVGRRTAFIHKDGCSEYLEQQGVQDAINTQYYYDADGKLTGENKYYQIGSQLGVWDIRDVGDVDAVKAAWQAIGSYGTYYDYSQEADGENITIGNKDHEKEKYGISEFGGDFALGKNEVSGSRIITGICPGYNALKTAWNDSATAAYVIYKVKPGSVLSADFYLNRTTFENSGKDFDFKIEAATDISGTWKNPKTTDSYSNGKINVLYTVPSDCKYVKITFPQKGYIGTAPGTRGNDLARLMGVRFIAE